MNTNKNGLYPLILKPIIKNYIWGGRRLEKLAGLQAGTDATVPIAEAWIVYEENLVLNGALAGQTLGSLAQNFGPELLGSQGGRKQPDRFPLLIKLMDCKQWLSVQVHPDDEQARRLEGPQSSGKTEAWYILDAQPATRLIAGIKPEISRELLAASIRQGKIMDLVQYHDIQAEDVLFMVPGTIHALGPGAFVYEIQQSSDITYRVYDWDRPRIPGRDLHIEKSIEVARPDAPFKFIRKQTGSDRLVECPYFNLEAVADQDGSFEADTSGRSFHALTVTAGEAMVSCGEFSQELAPCETVFIPAVCGKYSITGRFRLLRATM